LVDENPIATLDQAADLGEDPALLRLIPPRLLLAARCGEDADNSVSEDVDIASVDRVDEKDTLLRFFRAQLGGRDCLSWAVEDIVHVEAKRNAVDTLLRKLASLRRFFPGGEPMEMKKQCRALHHGLLLMLFTAVFCSKSSRTLQYVLPPRTFGTCVCVQLRTRDE